MPHNGVVNFVTRWKTNKINTMPCSYKFWRTTAVRRSHQVSSAAGNESQLHSMFPTDLHRKHSCSKSWLSHKSILVVSWMHLHICRCFQKHLTMLEQRLRPLCLTTVGSGSIWKSLGAWVRSAAVSERCVCGFQTDLQCHNQCAQCFKT